MSRRGETEAVRHLAEFRRVTENGSEFFRVRCLETGHTAMYWPSYLREGSPLAIVDEPKDGACFLDVDHEPSAAREKEPS